MASPKRARGFFWTVLIAATLVSIAANAAHAKLVVTSVPGVLAAAIATVPPVVLLVATEGLSILVRTNRRSSLIYATAVVMTVFLALAAFALSFFSLKDLALRCGIHPWLTWLWPLVVDVCIAQCTVVLQALNHQPDEQEIDERESVEVASTSSGDFSDGDDPDGPASPLELLDFDEPGDDAAPKDLLPVAQEIVGNGATRQPPEVVAEVLRRHHSGERAGKIASAMGLHHSTVNRLLNAGHRRALAENTR